MQYSRAGGLPGGGGPDGPGRPGRGRGLPDPPAAQRRLARPDRRAAAGRSRPGAAAGRPAGRAGRHLGRGCPGRPRAPARCCPPSHRRGGTRAAAWEAERRAAAEEVVHPALARWVATVKELLPRARPSQQAGLAYLPGGEEDYARAVRIYTTLPLSAEELHQTGLDHVAALEARAVELGAGLGLSGLDEVFAALRDSSGKIPPEEAMRQAAAAVKRAEARAGEFFPAAASAAVRGDAHAGGRGRERRGAALHPAPPRRRAARDVLVQHRAAHRRYRLGHRSGGLPRSGARASPAALPPPAAHRPARAPAPAQPRRVLRGMGPVRRAARRGSRAVRRRSRPARLDQHVADAGRPAGGGHRHPRLRLEPRAGPASSWPSTSPCRGSSSPPRSTGTW